MKVPVVSSKLPLPLADITPTYSLKPSLSSSVFLTPIVTSVLSETATQIDHKMPHYLHHLNNFEQILGPHQRKIEGLKCMLHP